MEGEGTSSTESLESAPAEQATDHISDVYGTTELSEAELSGVDDSEGEDADATTSEDDSSTESTTDESEATEQESTDETATESNTASSESEAEESEASAQESDGKPPKGYVPTAALHEARGENAYLKKQLAELQAKPNAQQSEEGETQTDDSGDFVVLSDQQLEELAVDDPSEAVLYMHRLNAHERKVAQQEAASAYEQTQVETARSAMEEVVPGLFGEDAAVSEAFEKEVGEFGFTTDLFYLTNPETMVLLPGEETPRNLGQDAAAMISMLANARSNTGKTPDMAKMREEIRAEVTKEVQAELLTKFKGDDAQFKSLSSLSASTGGKSTGGKSLADMTKAEEEAYLAGA